MKWFYSLVCVGFALLLGAMPHATQAQSAVLPAPLMLIDETGTIVRIETDAVTRRQIVLDTQPVSYFDVSPLDGSIMYVVANNLVLADANGQNPRVLVEGGIVQRDDYGMPTLNALMTNQVTHPVWSPDGKKIALGFGGVNILDIATQQRQILLPTGAPGESATPDMPIGAKIYHPKSWSPDGTKLLVTFGGVPDGTGSAILDVATGRLTEVKNADGYTFCCGMMAWSADSKSIFIASAAAFYLGEAGLWSYDVATGTVTNLGAIIYPTPDETTQAEFTGVQQLSDGSLYFFVNVMDFNALNADPTVTFEKRMMRVRPTGEGLEALRPNNTALYPIYDVLWSPTGNGAMVGLGGINYPPYIDNSTNTLYNVVAWLPVGDGNLLEMGFGTNLRWVK